MSILPYDRQAEHHTLGCMIRNPANLIEGCKHLSVADFTTDYTREIYSTIEYMFNEGQQVDATTVSARISEHNRKPLTIIMEESRESEHFGDYLTILHDRRARREIRLAVSEVISEASTNPDAIRVLEALERSAFKLRSKHNGKTKDNRHTSSELAGWFDEYLSDEWSDDGEYCFNHPLTGLQQSLGRFSRGEMGVIAGYSGDGKSVYALQHAAYAAASDGLRIGYYSLEMPEKQVWRRLASHTGVPVKTIKDRSWNEYERAILIERAKTMRDWQLDVHSGSVTVEQVRADQMKHDYDLVFIDHLHRMPGSSDRLKLEEMIRGFKTLALDASCGVIVLAQLARRDGYPMPTTNQLRGTEMITAESDWVLFVYRERNEMMQRTEDSKIIVGKARDGEADVIIECDFSPSSMLFHERSMIPVVSTPEEAIIV